MQEHLKTTEKQLKNTLYGYYNLKTIKKHLDELKKIVDEDKTL